MLLKLDHHTVFCKEKEHVHHRENNKDLLQFLNYCDFSLNESLVRIEVPANKEN